MRAGARLVDIRSDGQRAADGLIPGAQAVPRNMLEWRLDPVCPHRDPELSEPGTRIILLCHEGYQSSLAAATVRSFGVDATDVIGGFCAWRAAACRSRSRGSDAARGGVRERDPHQVADREHPDDLRALDRPAGGGSRRASSASPRAGSSRPARSSRARSSSSRATTASSRMPRATARSTSRSVRIPARRSPSSTSTAPTGAFDHARAQPRRAASRRRRSGDRVTCDRERWAWRGTVRENTRSGFSSRERDGWI